MQIISASLGTSINATAAMRDKSVNQAAGIFENSGMENSNFPARFL